METKSSNGEWIVIGVSGVTCGGKTMLTRALHERYPGSRLVMQDSYFLPESSERHVLVDGLSHFNWDCVGALDMSHMRKDVADLLASQPSGCDGGRGSGLLLLDGFLLFVDEWLSGICRRKYFFTLPHAVCRQRRTARVYTPPDVPGYFERCVWPEYERHKCTALQMNSDICLLDGQQPIDQHINTVTEEIDKLLLKHQHRSC